MSPPTLAVVAICYDRWDFLARTLPTWKTLAGAPEIFVGTYERDRVPGWVDDVRVVQVDGEPFHLSRMRNCVAAAARDAVSPDYLLFLDADIEIVDPDVFARALAGAAEPPDYVLDSPFALAAEYLLLHEDDPERADRGKRGTAVVRSSLFFEMGGYDQRMIGWGVEDRNLYQRCRELSERVAYFDRAGIVHLEHGFRLRFQHNPAGMDILRSLHRNAQTNTRAFDLRGEAWRADFGYPAGVVTCRRLGGS